MNIVRPHGGYGLGNDLIPWAKAWIFSQEANAFCMAPAWGDNPRQYWRYFYTPRWDYLIHSAMSKMYPSIPFTQDDYDAIGADDFREASREFMRLHGLHHRRHWMVEITGLWGAFEGLESSRLFILSRLLNTRFTLNNIYSIKKRLNRQSLLVGLHVRRGDFAQPYSWSYNSAINMSWPIEWYAHVMKSLTDSFGCGNIDFLICSNGSEIDLAPILAFDNVTFASQLPNSDISDLLLLADCDLICGSLSTFSMWAVFLGRALNLWYRDNFEKVMDSACVSPFHTLFRVRTGLPSSSLHSLISQGLVHEAPRSYACGMEADISESLLHQLWLVLQAKRTSYDLVRKGILYCP